MGDLIWVGNTLLPRGLVLLAAVIILIAVAGAIAGFIASVSTQKEPS